MTNTTADIQDNYWRVLDRIALAAVRSRRDPGEIGLIVVSKGRSLDMIKTLYRIGQRQFGENRPEESIPKAHAARTQFAPRKDPIVWHMIGHVQRRKAKMIIDDFDCVHSLDSIRLAERFGRMADDANRILPVLLECNVSGEASKHGFAADCFEQEGDQWASLTDKVASILCQQCLSVRGLMTMAPIMPDPEQARYSFQKLRRLRDRLAQLFPETTWGELSMGMTDDFEVAIEEGSTFVRVGRAVFGNYH